MINYNQKSFGQKLRVNFGQDVSAATVFSMKIEPRRGSLVTKTPTLGTTSAEEGDEKFLANQYVEYSIEENFFKNYRGLYRVRAIATLPTETIAANWIIFRVTS